MGLPAEVEREPMRVWARSGVERLRFPAGESLVFKYAETPFDAEHLALRLASSAGLPPPTLHAARTRLGLLDMLMEDLGDPVREADDRDGAHAAVLVHRVEEAALGMERLGTAALAAMPRRISGRLQRLDLSGLLDHARALEAVAAIRASSGDLPPFGLCHSEFHPTSLRIGGNGWHLVDFARAFIGPGSSILPLGLAPWRTRNRPARPI